MRLRFGVIIGIIGFLAAICVGCGDDDNDDEKIAVSADSQVSRNELIRKFMPRAMANGKIKVAVVTNLAGGDFSEQFFKGCQDEANELGFELEIFGSNGDTTVCQEILAKIAESDDYDGLVLSHGGADWSYDALLPATKKGIKIVTFDTSPYPNGDTTQEILAGVTATAQEDSFLAEASLGALIDTFAESVRPIRVIYIDGSKGVLPLERRGLVLSRYIEQGLIKEVARVELPSLSQARENTANAFAKALPNFPVGAIDAIWAPYDELAKGVLDALVAAGRRDIKVFSIDASDEDIRLMLANEDIWIATAAVDPQIIGRGSIRILATKFAGEPYFPQYVYSAQLIRTAVLLSTTTMETLAQRVNGWSDARGIIDDFLWMILIKRAK